ncbi:hypothetical protein DFH07DRAFT_798945 [Mycena maculata]|uniref:Secreted protein n=1 Tax=Mycena maculata TaxID=230809 RepID=A0AAD7K2Z3_9AGAR|nr:hypothetical protein DFH07DRAFT_798945 [Mycena maculata]
MPLAGVRVHLSFLALENAAGTAVAASIGSQRIPRCPKLRDPVERVRVVGCAAEQRESCHDVATETVRWQW